MKHRIRGGFRSGTCKGQDSRFTCIGSADVSRRSTTSDTTILSISRDLQRHSLWNHQRIKKRFIALHPSAATTFRSLYSISCKLREGVVAHQGVNNMSD